MGKQTFRKELSRKIEGNKETVEYEYYQFDNFITELEMTSLLEYHENDYEAAYDYGLAFDYSDELCWINVDKLLIWLEDYLSDEDDEKTYTEIFTALNEKLKKYVAYDIWF